MAQLLVCSLDILSHQGPSQVMPAGLFNTANTVSIELKFLGNDLICVEREEIKDAPMAEAEVGVGRHVDVQTETVEIGMVDDTLVKVLRAATSGSA